MKSRLRQDTQLTTSIFDNIVPSIFSVYKPRGISSYDVIRLIKKSHPGEKIGHGGTLDPEAEGVLVIALGKDYTKQLQPVLKGTAKTYEATLYLGAVSETDDSEGPIRKSNTDKDQPLKGRIVSTLKTFLGTTLQTPPRYSAVKIQGEPAYKRARRGEDFHIQPKEIHISDIELLSYDYPELTIRVSCGSGTYIRVLARNIGEKLGTGAYLLSLRRTAVGSFTEESSITFT